MRGNTEQAGGEQSAREMFKQLTGRDRTASFERVVLETIEVVYRAESRSGVPKVEIIDHTRKLYEKISLDLLQKSVS